MFMLVEVLGVSWSVGGVVYDFITGAASWVTAVEILLLISGLLTGAIAELLKQAGKASIRQLIKGLSRSAAIAL